MKVMPMLGIGMAKRKFGVCLRRAAQVQGARHSAAAPAQNGFETAAPNPWPGRAVRPA